MNIARKLARAGLLVLQDRTYDLLMSMRAEDETPGTGSAAGESDVPGIEARAQSAVS